MQLVYQKKENNMNRLFKVTLGLLVMFQFGLADLTQNQKVRTALNILDSFGRGNKSYNLKDIKAIAIIPNMTKGGVIITGHSGSGIFVARNDDNEWSSPVFIDYRGAGVGVQAGYQSSDLILLFKSSRSYDGLVNGKGSIDVSADASFFKSGVKTGVMTDLPEISAWATTPADNSGLFVGVSMNVSNIVVNNQDTNDYYERIYNIEDIYNNSPKESRYTQKLKEVILKYFD